jgi:hypothetical protein
LAVCLGREPHLHVPISVSGEQSCVAQNENYFYCLTGGAEEHLKQAKLTIVDLCAARSPGRPPQLSKEPFHSLAGGVGVVHSLRLIERELDQQF